MIKNKNVGIIWKILAIRQRHEDLCFSALSFYTFFFYLKNHTTTAAQTCSEWSNFPPCNTVLNPKLSVW